MNIKKDEVIFEYYTSNEYLKLEIMRAIQQKVKEIKRANNLLKYIKKNRVEFYKIENQEILEKSSNKDYAILQDVDLIILKLINKIHMIVKRKEKELGGIIRLLVTSKYLKKILNIKGNINSREINHLIEDIIESIYFLEFYKEYESFKFIIAYIRKFMVNN